MTPGKYLLILFALALTLCLLGWVAFALGWRGVCVASAIASNGAMLSAVFVMQYHNGENDRYKDGK